MRRALAASLALGWIMPLGCAISLTPAASQPRESSGSPVRYVALGDSYTIGTGVSPVDRWPDRLVERLHAQVTLQLVANLAVNGYTSADVIAFELPDLASLDPQFVTLLIGVNDVVEGVPSASYRANVDRILGAVLAFVPNDRMVIVSTPDYTRTPRGADFGNPERQRAGIATVNSIMAQAAAGRGIAFVDIGSVAVQAGRDRSLVAGDGLHPSGAQYALWVDLIAPVAESLFGGV